MLGLHDTDPSRCWAARLGRIKLQPTGSSPAAEPAGRFASPPTAASSRRGDSRLRDQGDHCSGGHCLAQSTLLSTVCAAAAAGDHSTPTTAPVGIDPFPLAGDIALVTGGSRGIGAAISKALARRGCKVAVVYRAGANAASTTLEALPGSGHKTFACDVGELSTVPSRPLFLRYLSSPRH